MLITAAVILSCFLMQETALAQNVEVGILSSPRRAGASVGIPLGSGTTGMLLRCYADILDVLDGSHSPGVMADWHLLFPVAERKMDGGMSMTLNAGAGLAAGHVRDFHDRAGLSGGLSGLFTAEFAFHRPIVISVGISGVLGCHMTSENKFSSTMTFYRNGIVRALIPEVTISYRFR